MSSWPRLLIQKLTEAPVVSRSETVFVLNVEFSAVDGVLWSWLQAQREDASRAKVELVLVDPEAGDAYDLLQDEFREGVYSNLRLVCAKNQIERIQRFFFRDSLRSEALANPLAIEESQVILIADMQDTLSGLDCTVATWTDDVPELPSDLANLKSPRQFVNDTSGAGLVPISVGTWLPSSEDYSDFTALYGAAISQRLARCIASSLLRDHDGKVVVLADLKRRVRAMVEDQDHEIWSDTHFTSALISSARWVYAEGKDVDNRHSILCAEIARSFPRDASWGSGLAEIIGTCLESAQIAYRLHLYDKSIDALKLMSDLRKGLADDVRAVAAQTSALASGLWRDAAVALGAIALKAILGGSHVLFITAAYLAVSWYLTTRAAAKSVAAIRSNERMFKAKLYAPLLPPTEYEEIAGGRYDEVIGEFEAFRLLVSWAYRITILMLVGAAIYPNIWQIWGGYACLSDHFARWFGGMFRADAINFFPVSCPAS